MSKDNSAPKRTGSSKKRYLATLVWRLPQNKAKRAARHKLRMSRQASKKMRIPRGTMRRVRRINLQPGIQ